MSVRPAEYPRQMVGPLLIGDSLLVSLSIPLTPNLFGIILALAIVLLFALLLFIRDTRDSLRKVWYLARAKVGVEVGFGGFVRLLLLSLLPATTSAFAKAEGNGKINFDWHLFFCMVAIVTAIGFFVNILNLSGNLKRILGPGAGHTWRDRRKVATAAILKKITANVDKRPVALSVIRPLLTDILDVIVLHVRDHRGHTREGHPEVFANILLDAGAELVVVARSSDSHRSQYKRQTPAVYQKSGSLCALAMAEKKPLSVGDFHKELPQSNRNKPYLSMLAIPLFRSDESVLGALSIDSSRPYFFQSFGLGEVENEIENNLQPYLQVIVLALEALVSRDPASTLALLAQAEAGSGTVTKGESNG